MTNQNSAAQAAMQRPIDEAIVILTEEAAALRECHTPSGDRDDWTGESEAKAAHDNMLRVAAALSKLRAPVADERAAFKKCYSAIIKAISSIARADGPDTREEDDPELLYRSPVMDEVVRIRVALDECSAALASAPVAKEAQPAAYLTLDEEGSPCMLFFDVVEACSYCALGEVPEPLFRHAAPQASAEDFDFVAHLARQAEFSARTFGPGARVAGVCDHIRKELIEVETSGGDLKEWVDVIILGLDGAWRSGATPQEIIAAIVAKQAKNEARTWPDWRTVDPTKAIEHDRGGQP